MLDNNFYSTIILLVGLYEDSNLGDKVIFDCTKKELQREDKTKIVPLYLLPKLSIFERSILKFYRIIGKEYTRYNVLMRIYYQKFASYVRTCDKVVFAGGGLIKYKSQFFGAQISAVIKAAEKYCKSVYFNAVGVEGYDANDIRCQILRNALNSNCVKFVSTRDDIDCLNNNYIENKDIKTCLVADPAVFSSKIYGIYKHRSEVIGIGLIRGNIFIDNKVDFSSEQLQEFYISFISLLQSKGYKIQLFTNGMKMDLELADNICTACGIDKDGIIMPKTASELVEIISNFHCVVSGRLHACIIAYSLGIPALGLGWNDKLKMFGKNITFPERFIEPEFLNAEYVCARMEEALKQGYNEENRNKFVQTQIKSVEDIIND